MDSVFEENVPEENERAADIFTVIPKQDDISCFGLYSAPRRMARKRKYGKPLEDFAIIQKKNTPVKGFPEQIRQFAIPHNTKYEGKSVS